MTIKIRAANLGDLPACVELAKVPELSTPTGKSPSLKWLEGIVKEKQIFLIAEDKGVIIGFRMGERIASDFAIAHLIVVRKDYRRKGVGKMLVKSFEDECKKRNLRGIVTYAHKEKKVLDFFKKNNYNLGQTVVECNKIF
jgi:N-acetylglutamate synthase-like GNAT family acetyltransferase